MTMNTLKEAYLAELQELHNVEEQLIQALPKMRDKAQHDELKQAFDQHLEETRSQRERVEGIRATGAVAVSLPSRSAP
jgi:ferritin-like metal-binding protein YciE